MAELRDTIINGDLIITGTLKTEFVEFAVGTLNFNVDSTYGVNIATGASTGTISIASGSGIQTVDIGSTSATKTVNIQGVVNINAVSGSYATNIGTGTSTGTVSVGTGASAQTIDVGTGAGVKAISIGSNNTTSTTTIKSGSGGVLINNSNGTNPTSVGSGTTTGAITIGGSGIQSIGIGNNAAGVKTVGICSTALAHVITIGSSSISATSSITSGTFNAISKRELKENIIDFNTSALDIINNTKIVSFNFKQDEDKKFRVGFIADDTDSILSGENKDIMDLYNSIGILLKAVQELNSEVKELKKPWWKKIFKSKNK